MFTRHLLPILLFTKVLIATNDEFFFVPSRKFHPKNNYCIEF